MYTIRMKIIVLAAVAHLAVTGVLAADLVIDWWTLDGGGVIAATGGTLELSGTIGQSEAGVVMTGGTLELSGGFWVGGGYALPGDFDGDGDVDLNDFNRFAVCLNGPNVTMPPPGCYPDEFSRADLDDDSDVDLADFGGFQRSFTSGVF